MRIRRMTGADLDAVDAMEQACFSVPWTRQDLEDFLGREDTVFLVAEQTGGGSLSEGSPGEPLQREDPAGGGAYLSGYCGAMVLSGDADVLNIAVDAAARRQGIGRALLEALLGQCRSMGAERVFLEVRESNEAAIALYASCGFSGIGRRRNYYTRPDEDAVLMKLEYGEEQRDERQ